MGREKMKEYCDQCGFELFEGETFCSDYCEALAKHDMDESRIINQPSDELVKL
jgi:predicted nucleic acid-binding Zn ribbon protein